MVALKINIGPIYILTTKWKAKIKPNKQQQKLRKGKKKSYSFHWLREPNIEMFLTILDPLNLPATCTTKGCYTSSEYFHSNQIQQLLVGNLGIV